MILTKVKRKGVSTSVHWTTLSANQLTTTEHSITSAEDPEPEFLTALDALKVHVLDVLELPESYGEGLRITGVSLSYDAEDRMGVVVTCLKDLDGTNAPLVLNTPYLPEPNFDQPDQPAMNDEFVEAIDEVKKWAKRFTEGKRAQAELFDDAA